MVEILACLKGRRLDIFSWSLFSTRDFQCLYTVLLTACYHSYLSFKRKGTNYPNVTGRLSTFGFKWELLKMLKSCVKVQWGLSSSPGKEVTRPQQHAKLYLKQPKKSYRNLKSHIYTEMCPINIVNKKSLKFQSIFLFLLLNFILAAAALNIP